MNGPYFIGASQGKHFYEGLADVIREQHPEARGKHIFEQLKTLGLDEEFRRGNTPCGLPFSFTEYES